MGRGPAIVCRGGAQAQGGEAGLQLGVRAFAPTDRLPSLGRQLKGQRLGGDWLMVWIAALMDSGGPSSKVPGRRRAVARSPYTQSRVYGHSIDQAQRRAAGAQGAVAAIGRVGQHNAGRHALGMGRTDLVEGDLRLGFERNLVGTLAFLRRSGSSTQACGRYRRQAIGRLAELLATDRLTATWQLSCLPSWPQYCRATPTEWLPFLGNPVSSTIQARIGSRRSRIGRTCSPIRPSRASSDHAAWPTKCRSD